MIDQTIQFYVILALLALNTIFLVLFFLQRRRLNSFLRGKNAESLENLIKSSLKNVEDMDLNFKKILAETNEQKKQFAATIKKVGVIRFNPFNNTGGDQSFALALLDSNNSGIVISSLYLREGTRIYAKPIKELKSSYPLSKEEEEAINKAIDEK